MSNIAQGRNRISRKELAQFVVEQFNSFVSVRVNFLHQVASVGSFYLIISDHGRKIMVEPRMDARRGSKRVQHQQHMPDVLIYSRSTCVAASLPREKSVPQSQESITRP